MSAFSRISTLSKFSIGFILIATVIIFYFLITLGFFKEVHLTELKSSTKIVLGQYYNGQAKDEKFGKLYLSVGSMNDSIEGKPCGIFYNNPSNSQGEIEGVVGLLVEDSTRTAPKGFKYFVVPERPTVRATIDADPRVLTSKGYRAIFDYCEEQSILTSENFFEVFSDSETYIEMAVGTENTIPDTGSPK